MTIDRSQPSRSQAVLFALLLLIANVIIAGTLFGVEYSAYNGSIEGTFVAIPRIMAKYPGQWQWWPFWNGGLPFEVAYLPFSHWMVAGFTLLTGLSAGRAFHIVSAAIYVASASAVFWMALEFSRRLMASLIAALAYSCVSVSALLLPMVAADSVGALNLRRLQLLVVYGEWPHTVALALLPVAMICFSRALTRDGVKWKLIAGFAAACVFLSNAFGMVMLPAGLLCWLIAFAERPWWKSPATAAAIGVVTFAWISPWFSPAMIRAIRANAATVGGDFRYRTVNWIALSIAVIVFILLSLAAHRLRASPHLRFFLLFGYIATAIVVIFSVWDVAIIPQPNRYQLEMDLALPLAIVFAGAAVLDRFPPWVRSAVGALVIAGLAAQTVHSALYGRGLIRAADPARLGELRIAKWIEQNRPGERAFLSGSSRFLFNDFTDNPQLTGGHDQHTVNTFLPTVEYTIYSGTNAGDRDADYSIFWLKAFGAHLISVPGPGSNDYYKPVAHLHKFDGILPLLWSEQGDSIYEVPVRSRSLAHVIPASAVVVRAPAHGLDIAPVEPYVAAIEDARYPVARFRWKNMSEAEIEATVDRGQVISVQVTYERGWEAWASGRKQPVRGDAIGQIVIEPDCAGSCSVSLRYTGGWEHVATRGMSLCALIFAVAYGWRGRRRLASQA